VALTMQEKQAVTKELARRYVRANRQMKNAIIDQVIGIAGYNRSYATWLLRTYGRRVTLPAGGKVVLVQTATRDETRRRSRPRVYDEKVLSALKRVWRIMDCICGKRLAPFLPELVPILERHEELVLDADTRGRLSTISAASIDRLLAEEKARQRFLERAGGKPDSLLLLKIPIQAHTECRADQPGYVEVDLVGHDGGVSSGEYCQTLDVTDRYSGWTETAAVRNKAHLWVLGAFKDIRQRLPFPLLGIHPDSGREFINQALFDYCQSEKLEFTRSRPGNKNDNCWVEQKNYSVVRRAVGYLRYETPRQLLLLNRLYRVLRSYTDYFQPTVKFLAKTRIGSRVSKRYDKALTPYRRLLAWPGLTAPDRARLAAEYGALNPADLKRRCERLQRQLLKEVEGQAAPISLRRTGHGGNQE